MENNKIIETENKKKYLISVSEEYFYQTYKNWSSIAGPERKILRDAFIQEVESFCLGITSKGISEMRFIDRHQTLRQAVTIVVLDEK